MFIIMCAYVNNNDNTTFVFDKIKTSYISCV